MLRLIFKKPVGFMLLTALLCALGLYLASLLPVLMYPQTRRPLVTVRIAHSGISAIDFHENFSERIEPGLRALEGVELTEASYAADASAFTLTFGWEVKGDDALAAVQEAMASINSGLPAELRDSYTIRFREGENAGFVVMGVNSASTSPEQLMGYLKRNVEPRLRAIRDVQEFGIYGLEELRVRVTLDQLALLSYGIGISEVNAAFQLSGTPQAVGTLREGGERYGVRLIAEARSLATLSRMEIARVGDSIIRLEDVAELEIRYALPSRVFLIGDKPAIQVNLTPVEGGNLNRLTDELIAVMRSAKEEALIPEDTSYELYVDPAKYIKRSIGQVVNAALIGGALAIIIIFLILGEIRNTLVIALSLPLSIALSFLPMYFMGVSLNLISLGGFALAVGMIVDSTIVVMENIHRWRHEDRRSQEPRHWAHVVMDATRQVRAPVLASTLTSVLVFLPLSFTAPLANAILGNQAMTVVFALLASLAVSLTVVPLVAYLLFKGPKARRLDRGEPTGYARYADRASGAVIAGYKRVLEYIIGRPARAAIFLAITFSAMAGFIALFLPSIPKEIMSKPQSDRVVLFFRHEETTDTLEVVENLMPDLRERLDVALSGLSYRSFANVSGRMNQLLVDFEDPSAAGEAIGRLEAAFPSEGLWYFNIQSWDPAALPLPQVFDLRVSVSGPDAAQKVRILDDIQRLLNESKLYGRIFLRPSPALARELILKPRDEVLGGFPGLSASGLGTTLRRALGGTASITLSDGNYDVSVSARFPDTDIDSRDKLARYLIPWRGQYVPIRHFFDFQEKSTVSQVYAVDGELAFRLFATASGGVSDAERAGLAAQAKTLIQERLELPDGYSYAFDNPRAEIDGAIGSLFIAMAVSVALIYLLLCFQFNSLWLPLVILVSIPLGFVGVTLSLYAFGSTLNLNSLLGTILLGGIVVNNAIIMIDFYLATRSEYADHRSALVATAGLRFKPILITTLTTIFGMLPIAIGYGSGASILQPLGIAVTGGLVVSTFVTLFAVPAILSFWRYEP
jgi:hydrophobic/amphiphilic exporter-1 (mainly G- bacteria), HAE1 family